MGHSVLAFVIVIGILVFVHEFGHFIGLDHCQLNGQYVGDYNTDNDIYVPTMYPTATDDDTSLEYYKVYVPLWDLNILTRYIPDFLPGHLYFPLFRDTRILVDLSLHKARVARVLD